MKLRFIVMMIITALGYIIMCSYQNGPGAHGYDCTGAETGLGNPSGCTNCHGVSATANIAVMIELIDTTTGLTTTQYEAGKVYYVKLTGTNNGFTTQSKFGFQMSCIRGSVALATPVNAGTWSTVLPANTRISNPQAGNFVVRLVEHTVPLLPTSGSGSNGTIYSKQFIWTPLATDTTTISFWASLNAVNNSSTDVGDLWNKTKLVVTYSTSTTGLSKIPGRDSDDSWFSIYPNPLSDKLNIRYAVEKSGAVKLKLLDCNGRLIQTWIPEETTTGSYQNTLDIPLNLNAGIYFLEIQTETGNAVRKVLVQQ